jgi:hypothetical protein
MKLMSSSDAITLLLRACPGIDRQWQEHLDDWGNEERGDYNDISIVVHYLVDCYKQEQTDFFPELFNLVERCINEGDNQTRDLMIIGLLEGIQNVASWQSFGNGVFVQWLGPKSREAWKQLERLWNGKSSLMEVIREEKRRSKP